MRIRLGLKEDRWWINGGSNESKMRIEEGSTCDKCRIDGKLMED